ncbi:FAD-binding oxidoreductase [Streptomyces luteolifulvus]|jgi:FAD/FMN-containing dehydrogenase|uniref:FAD-binding oxidoreductase n=1 Tax=Streptomyces luteolifulvus TaxID=2615112 RepID=A0A6H9UVS2_9ACTN|nr:FAD-binding oxidoreductase [Streptomyces luteolifulvus]KAB1144258.1 FAD-binding oxidoreductase [Streptomyces luteolifulvus]
MSEEIEGAVVRRGDPAYDGVWAEMLWNDLKPQRFPDLIVRVASDRDVPAAVRLARSEGHRIALRSHGHSWCGSPLRDGGMLIDLSALNGCEIDPVSRTATLQPALSGREFVAALAPYGLAFPAGHCGPVALGGFLLSGGLGWNSGALGPAAASVRAVEVVTADGTALTCSLHENPDLFWAACGAGPGFFAVATRFHVTLHALPTAVAETTYVFPLADVEPVTRWATTAARRLPANVEASFMLATASPDITAATERPKVISFTGTAFARTREEAVRCLQPLRACPFAERALFQKTDEPKTFEDLYGTSSDFWPRGHRNVVDTLWSDTALDILLPALAAQVAEAPSEQSLVLAPLWPASRDRTLSLDMAFSVLGENYIAPFAIWDDPAEDAANIRWLRDTMRTVEPYGTGHYIAEADLTADATRARRSYTPDDWERLRALKAAHDPENVFHTYLTP